MLIWVGMTGSDRVTIQGGLIGSGSLSGERGIQSVLVWLEEEESVCQLQGRVTMKTLTHQECQLVGILQDMW